MSVNLDWELTKIEMQQLYLSLSQTSLSRFSRLHRLDHSSSQRGTEQNADIIVVPQSRQFVPLCYCSHNPPTSFVHATWYFAVLWSDYWLEEQTLVSRVIPTKLLSLYFLKNNFYIQFLSDSYCFGCIMNLKNYFELCITIFSYIFLSHVYLNAENPPTCTSSWYNAGFVASLLIAIAAFWPLGPQMVQGCPTRTSKTLEPLGPLCTSRGTAGLQKE